MIIVGLTGSIGMGKTEIANMFADLGAAVLHSDGIVHNLYESDEQAIKAVRKAFPESYENGRISREKLSRLVLDDKKALKRLENIIHPFVHGVQQEFISMARDKKALLVILEIPLLFETGAEKRLDKTINVSASEEIQRARVMSRPEMKEAKLNAILSRQMPDEQKCRLADYVIENSSSLEAARVQVKNLFEKFKSM